MSVSGRSDLVDIAGEKRGETEKAFRIFDGTRTEWVPPSGVLSSARSASREKGALLCAELDRLISTAVRKELA